MDQNLEKRFAILIDADNISEKYVSIILDEVSNLGIATYKRIYGDWTSQRLVSWKACLLENSIIPMQQYSYTTGKNATDSAMIIDAMDILYSGNVDGFAIVSSDSDFTRLVARLRESGMQVIGMGEQKTAQPFIAACNQFKYLDLLYAQRKEEEEQEHENETEQGIAAPRVKRHPGDAGGTSATIATDSSVIQRVSFDELSKAARRAHLRRIRNAIENIIDKFSDDDGWVTLGRVGDELSKRLPDFDVRNYGYKKLRPFLKSLGIYEFDESDEGSDRNQIYLRLRDEQ